MLFLWEIDGATGEITHEKDLRDIAIDYKVNAICRNVAYS